MANELDDFEAYLLAEAQKEMDKVSKDIEETLKKNVQKDVYSKYTPKRYTRTQQLKNKITISKNNREAIVGWQGQEYINNRGEDVSDKVPIFINNGFKHKNWNGKVDMYHQREASNFLEDTIQEINVKYGEEVCQKIEW